MYQAKFVFLTMIRDHTGLDYTQLTALKEFLPTADERKGLEAYVAQHAISDDSKQSAYTNLSESEKYMLTMMTVSDAPAKFDCMIFRVQFRQRLSESLDAVKVVKEACLEVKSSERLRKIMAMILTLVNEINTGGDGREEVGFSLDALLKLNEVSC
jgi:hypothetical protein